MMMWMIVWMEGQRALTMPEGMAKVLAEWLVPHGSSSNIQRLLHDISKVSESGIKLVRKNDRVQCFRFVL
jgi:hypothetical protein